VRREHWNDERPPEPKSRYTWVEELFVWLSFFKPGLVAGFLAHWVAVQGMPTPTEEWIGTITFFLILFGCCGFPAWILAHRAGEDRLVKRTIKLALFFLILQLFLGPSVAGICFLLLELF
jgi:hypothetical protein